MVRISNSLISSLPVFLVFLMLSACAPQAPVPPKDVDIDFSKASVLLKPASTKLSADVDDGDFGPELRIPPEAFRFFEPNSNEITTIVSSSSGRNLYSGSRDGEVHVYSINREGSGLNKKTIFSSDRPIFALALSADNSKLAISQYSYISVLDLRSGKLISQLTLIDGRIISMAWDATGELLALGRSNGDVFVWDAKTNNTRQLERYSTATSPIVGLVFHPQSRALFVLERTGGLYLWRIIRTEYQLGLRDETAEIDKALQGRVVSVIGRVPGQASSLWLDSKNLEVIAINQSGMVFNWSIRGLVAGQKIDVGPLNAGIIGGISASSPSGKRVSMLYVGGRGEKLQLWCRAVVPDLLVDLSSQVAVVKPGENLAPKPPIDPLFGDPDLEEELEEELEEKVEDESPGLIATSSLLKSSISHAYYRGSTLWLVLSDGRIGYFSPESLISSTAFSKRAANCLNSSSS